MQKAVFILFLILGVPLIIDIGGKIRDEQKLQSKELIIIVVYVFCLCFSGTAVHSLYTQSENGQGNLPQQTQPTSPTDVVDNTDKKTVAPEDVELYTGEQQEINTNEYDEIDALKSNLNIFFDTYDKSHELGVYFVCADRFDIICDIKQTSVDAESILKDMAEFIVKNGYRKKIMSITLNVSQANNKKSVVVVEDFFSEALPYIHYSLYKNGVVTETTMMMNVDAMKS